MEATLKASNLKSFAKSLTCLSKYGDVLTFQATKEGLALSCTNSSKSAYARFTYVAAYWKKWNLKKEVPFTFTTQVDLGEVKGEVGIKVFLAILRARTTDKTVESVDIELYEGPSSSQNSEERDELSSQLIVRINCKQGVTRTHKLNISVPTIILGPRLPPDSIEVSKLRISADAVKDILEHFSLTSSKSGGGKMRDLQLIWEFGETKVRVRSEDVGRESDFLSTELDVDFREFEAYEIQNPPVSIAFQLREFSATITHACQLSLPLNFHFTSPGQPIFMEIETDDFEDPDPDPEADGTGVGLWECFFAIASMRVEDNLSEEENTGDRKGVKEKRRDREESASMTDRRPSKVNRVVSKKVVGKNTNGDGGSRGGSQISMRRISAAPSAANAPQRSQAPRPSALSQPPPNRPDSPIRLANSNPGQNEEPLFFPGTQPQPPSASRASQRSMAQMPSLSQAEQRILQQSGWGDGKVAYEDFQSFMDEEGIEIDIGGDPVPSRSAEALGLKKPPCTGALQGIRSNGKVSVDGGGKNEMVRYGREELFEDIRDEKELSLGEVLALPSDGEPDSPPPASPRSGSNEGDSNEGRGNENTELPATQNPISSNFRPLFDD